MNGFVMALSAGAFIMATAAQFHASSKLIKVKDIKN
jgi:hypothetical protein